MIGAFQAGVLTNTTEVVGIPTDVFAQWLTVSGTTLIDSAATPHNLTLVNGPTVNNHAVTFDGTNDYARYAAGMPYNSPIVTISFRINLSSLKTSAQVLFETGADYNTNTGFLIAARDPIAANMSFSIKDGTGYISSHAAIINPDVVQHLIVEFNKTAHTVRVWNASGEVTLTNTINTSTDTSNFIGTNALNVFARNGASLFTQGTLYPNTRMYTRVMTAGERSALFAEA